MPRFHFNSDNHVDPKGHELESVAAAKCEAIKMFGSIVCEEADSFWDRAEWTMTVTDDRGLTLFQIHIVGLDSAALLNTVRRA